MPRSSSGFCSARGAADTQSRAGAGCQAVVQVCGHQDLVVTIPQTQIDFLLDLKVAAKL